MSRVRSSVVPLYLLACILAGGSAQDVWGNLALEAAGLALLAWAAMTREPQASGWSALDWLIAAAGVWVLLQLIPLPPAVWTPLPGRSGLENEFYLLNEQLPWLAVSLAPLKSVLTLFAAIPPLALYAGVRNLETSPRFVTAAVAAGTLINIALAAIQVSSGGSSWAYFYPITNTGAVGSFANANHMGTLLLICIPFLVALLLSWPTKQRQHRQAKVVVVLCALALLAVGIVLNGSIAVLALAAPVALASAALVPRLARWRRVLLAAAALLLCAAIVILATVPFSGSNALGANSSISSRAIIWANTAAGIETNFPGGSGLGTFEQVYREHEDPAAVTAEYVNHAHNDYLELALELGAVGILVMCLFLLWWTARTFAIWNSAAGGIFPRAATIASAAILAHSVVDFPARTAAMSSVLGVSLAWMRRNSDVRSAAGGGARPKHVTL